jgi:hypothetical protein
MAAKPQSSLSCALGSLTEGVEASKQLSSAQLRPSLCERLGRLAEFPEPTRQSPAVEPRLLPILDARPSGRGFGSQQTALSIGRPFSGISTDSQARRLGALTELTGLGRFVVHFKVLGQTEDFIEGGER